jgi:hypothetical protein
MRRIAPITIAINPESVCHLCLTETAEAKKYKKSNKEI